MVTEEYSGMQCACQFPYALRMPDAGFSRRLLRTLLAGPGAPRAPKLSGDTRGSYATLD